MPGSSEKYPELLDTLLSPIPADVLEAPSNRDIDPFDLACERLEPYEVTAENLEDILTELGGRFIERTPVITDAEMQQYKRERVAHRWQVVGGVMLHAIQKGEWDTTAGQSILAEPITEATPGRLVTAAAQQSPLVRRALDIHPAVRSYVEIPAVPDDMLGAGFNEFQQLVSPHDVIDAVYGSTGDDDPDMVLMLAKEQLERHQQHGSFRNGITKSERDLAYTRYPMARDSALLAIGAELQANPGLQPDQQNRITLPSGSVITIVPGQEDAAAALLDVQQWRGRRTIMDRVSLVETASGKYILKEHKTKYHVHVPPPHVSPRSTAEEVAIATELSQRVPTAGALASISWERPIGYLEVPNGFSAAVFAYEEGLIPLDKVNSQIEQAIRQHPEPYRAEFDTITAIAGNETVTWDDYAAAKARMLRTYASDLLVKDTIGAGFTNSDPKATLVDHAFRIHVPDNGTDELGIEIIGFDYEFFMPLEVNIAAEKRRFEEEFVTRRAASLLNGWCGGGYISDGLSRAIRQITAYRQSAGLPITVGPFASPDSNT